MKEKLITSLLILGMCSGFFMLAWERAFPQYTPWEINKKTVCVLDSCNVGPVVAAFWIVGG